METLRDQSKNRKQTSPSLSGSIKANAQEKTTHQESVTEKKQKRSEEIIRADPRASDTELVKQFKLSMTKLFFMARYS